MFIIKRNSQHIFSAPKQFDYFIILILCDKMVDMVKKKYLDDYETIYTNEEGKEKKVIIYRGPYYEIDLDQKGLIRFRRNSLLLLILIVFLHIGVGFLNNRGMYQFFIALPYVIALFPLWNIMSGILRIPQQKDKYRRNEVELSFDRIGNSSMVLLICLGIELLGEIIFLLFFSTTGELGAELLFLLPELIAAAAVYVLFRLQKNIQILICPEE